MDLTMMERVGDRWEKMKGSCLTGQSLQWAVVLVEEEEEEEEEEEDYHRPRYHLLL
jgi:predicted RNase H-like nuclease (RuvC/YqgF family)